MSASAVTVRLSVVVALLACATLATSRASSAQDCPTAQSAPGGFRLERDNASSTEVVFPEGRNVRNVYRVWGQVTLETTAFEGLFDLEQVGRKGSTVFRPKTDLAGFFPLTVGQAMSLDVEVEDQSGAKWTVRSMLKVTRSDALNIGPCKYEVVVVERQSGFIGAPVPPPVGIDYYAPALRSIIAK